MTNDENWPIGQSSGAFLSFEAKPHIPDYLKDIGLGASMYLLTLKSIGKIFVFLSIFNIPAMYIFFSGTEGANRDGLSSIAKYFLMFSLGNLGD